MNQSLAVVCSTPTVALRLLSLRRVIVGLMASLVLVGPGFAWAEPIEADSLSRKREDQQRARAMTRSLLESILDLQLRQLEENGLKDLPAYRDIGLMREHLQEIVDEEMIKVVDVLTQAQAQNPAEREASFVTARQMIRSIVVQLSAERQTLLRRLKVAELAEQATRLLQLQTHVRNTTEQLPELPENRREAQTLKTQEDQRDVKDLFLHLVETLDDVRSWGGPISQAAVDGLRVLKASDVGRHLDTAEVELKEIKFTPAVEHQNGAIRGLQDLLRVLQKTQGTMDSERHAAVERIQRLAEQQAAIREQTRQLPMDEPAPPELVEKQVQVEKELASLQGEFAETPTAETLAEQAETAAKQATQELFDGKKEPAIERQSQVLGNLAAIEAALRKGTEEPMSEKSAEELAAVVEALKTTADQLSTAQKQQAAAAAALPNADAATAAERATEAAVTAAMPAAEVGPTVEQALKTAQQATKSAADLLDAAADQATSAEMQAVAAATRAVDEARATVSAELRDAQRLAEAVKIGELARAAEALERAAAEERAVSKELAKSAQGTATSTDETTALAERQADVASIAQKVAEGLKSIAPESAEKTRAAAKNAADAETSLAAASAGQQSPNEAAKQAAPKAQAAADGLAEAARAVREEVKAAAEKLAQLTASQAAEVAAARDAVEAAAAPTVASLGERVEQIQQARNKTREAMQEQLRAEGKSAAADAMELADQVAAVDRAQSQADAAAQAFERGDAATPLKATTSQQATADAAGKAAEAAVEVARNGGDPETLKSLTESLKAAQSAAESAAKQTLAGKAAEAAASRADARNALAKAKQAAAQLAEQTRQAPAAAEPNANAERAAAAAAEQARDLAAADDPAASAELAEAATAAQTAADALARGETTPVRPAQEKASEKLAAAAKKLDGTLQELANQQARELAKQQPLLAALADKVSPIEPAAGRSLAAAEDAAALANEPNRTPETLASAAKSAEQMLDRAAATLAAKELELQRDEAVAKAVATMASKQQDAATMLAQERERATQTAQSADPAASPSVNAEAASAAAQEFVEAQRATGQAAVEISGQAQVVNAPLREALEMIGQLTSAQLAAAASEAAELAMAAEAGEVDPSEPSSSPSATPDGAPAEAANPSSQKPSPSGNGESPSAKPSSGRNSASPSSSDTGFVPQTPELTAQLMAGPELTEAMNAAAAQQSRQPPSASATPQNTSPGQQGLETQSQTQTSDQAATNEGSAMQANRRGSDTKNQKVKDGPLDVQAEGTDLGDSKSGTRQGDADGPTLQFQEEAWFAKLPPELRKSLRAGTQQKAPRAYEDRLRRYFQSVD